MNNEKTDTPRQTVEAAYRSSGLTVSEFGLRLLEGLQRLTPEAALAAWRASRVSGKSIVEHFESQQSLPDLMEQGRVGQSQTTEPDFLSSVPPASLKLQ